MRIQHILLAILVAAVWGFNFIFVKLGVHDIPPLFLCAVRFFLVSIPAIFFVPRPSQSFKMVILYGLVMFALQFSLIFTGIAVGMTAGMASLLTQTAVFFSILFAALFNAEIPTFWQISGALLSFSGIAFASTHIDSHMTYMGFLLIIAGSCALGLGTLINRKLGHLKVASLVSWGSLFAFPPLLIVSMIVEGPALILSSIHHFSWLALISLLYIVYISTWIGYGTWGWLIGRYPVSTVVPFTLLVPVFAMISSILFMGESLESWKLTVAGLVIGGLCVNIIMPRILNKKVGQLTLNTAEE